MMSKLENIAYIVIVILIALGTYLSRFHEEFFLNRYVVEDGPLESGTAIFLFLAGVIMIVRAIRLRGKRTKLFITVTALAGFVMFFGAGEEISWGQRIFDIETPEALAQHNKQGETNLHNLEIGDVSINKLVFSKLLAVGLVFYLLILPTWATKSPKIASLVKKFAVPIPTKKQIIMWIVALALPELLVATGKKGEVREVGAGIMALLTLAAPRNVRIYRDETLPSEHVQAAS